MRSNVLPVFEEERQQLNFVGIEAEIEQLSQQSTELQQQLDALQNASNGLQEQLNQQRQDNARNCQKNWIKRVINYKVHVDVMLH